MCRLSLLGEGYKVGQSGWNRGVRSLSTSSSARLVSDVGDKTRDSTDSLFPRRRKIQNKLHDENNNKKKGAAAAADDDAMFHRKRHHHHQHSRPAVANRQTEENDTNEVGSKRHSEPAAVGVDIEPRESSSPSRSLKSGHIESTDLGTELSAFRRRCTSPICATTVEMAASMVEGFRLPNHSPSPVRKQVGVSLPGRSLSAASPENNNTHTSLTSSPSSLGGLFRRKRSPMDLSSQSFHSKSSPSSSVSELKPSTAPKPQRLNTHGSGGGGGPVEPKGRSLSPMPSGNHLAAMVMNSIHSAVLDVGQSASERQSRKANTLHHHNAPQPQQQQPLPQLVINAKSSECLAISSEPTSPFADPRQPFLISHFLICVSASERVQLSIDREILADSRPVVDRF